MTDRYRYCRAPAGDNAPISIWSNRWSTMPVHHHPELRLPRPDDRAWLDRMPGSDVPEADLADGLRQALTEVECPSDQLERLGLD